MRLSRLFAVALIGIVVAAACSGGAPGAEQAAAEEADQPEVATEAGPQETAAAEPPAAPAPAAPAPSAATTTDGGEPSDAPAEAASDAALRVALTIADEAERAALAERFASRDEFAITTDSSEADIELSDRALSGGGAFVLDAWVVVAHQRQRVLEISLDQVRRIVAGATWDWSQLRAEASAMTVLLPAEDAATIARALGVERLGANVELVDASSIGELVRSDAGAWAIVRAETLGSGLLAMVVDGHDPLRDPLAQSPIRVERWLRASDEAAAERALAVLGWTERRPTANPVGLLATGDFIPVRCTRAAIALFAGGDHREIFAKTGDRLRAADIAVVSMEASATDVRVPTPCINVMEQFVLQAGPEAVEGLAFAGVDVLTTAGNHAGDCNGGCRWPEALLDTIANIDAAGIAHAGTGADLAAARAPAIVERDGVRVAFLSYDDIAAWYFATEETPGTAPLDLATLGDDVRAAKRVANHVVVSMSWGTEYTPIVTRRQREAIRIAVEAGASLVIGNHPHWVQPVETFDDAVAVYALGNFVFDQDWSVGTTQSMTLEIGFDRDRIVGYRFRPVVIRHNYQPEFVDPLGDEGAEIFERLWRATDALPEREA